MPIVVAIITKGHMKTSSSYLPLLLMSSSLLRDYRSGMCGGDGRRCGATLAGRQGVGDAYTKAGAGFGRMATLRRSVSRHQRLLRGSEANRTSEVVLTWNLRKPFKSEHPSTMRSEAILNQRSCHILTRKRVIQIKGPQRGGHE